MKTIIASGVLAVLASSATAQDFENLSIGLGVSGFGGSVEAASRIDPNFGVRGAFWGGVDLSYEETDEETDISGDFKLGGIALLGDYYPNQSNWRVSGGVFFSNSELSATGTENVGGSDESVTTNASFKNEISPMIATGYEFDVAPQWSINAEVGVIFTGGVDVEFTATDPTAQDAVDDDPDLQEIKDDAEDLIIYPHVGLTLSYRF